MQASIREQFSSIPKWVALVPPRNDVASYYRMADVFISASREESFCNALVETTYSERPVIASRIPAQRDLRIPHAFWFEPGSTADLKAKLHELPAVRDGFAPQLRQARAAVEQTYDIDAWARRIVAIYEDDGPDAMARRGAREQAV